MYAYIYVYMRYSYVSHIYIFYCTINSTYFIICNHIYIHIESLPLSTQIDLNLCKITFYNSVMSSVFNLFANLDVSEYVCVYLFVCH